MITNTSSTYYLDFENDKIQYLVAEFRDLQIQDQIKGLYLKVRDGWRYNPFKIGFTKEHYVASNIYNYNEAHCIDKAILLTAGLRALDIPARLHFAKVSNHIAAERLIAKVGTNELAPHGMVDVFYNNKWSKCSPAFNKELCDKYNVEVLDFDGTEDSIMQEFNRDNEQFMTYLEDYGSFDDVPLDRIKEIFATNYPNFAKLYKGEDEVII